MMNSYSPWLPSLSAMAFNLFGAEAQILCISFALAQHIPISLEIQGVLAYHGFVYHGFAHHGFFEGFKTSSITIYSCISRIFQGQGVKENLL